MVPLLNNSITFYSQLKWRAVIFSTSQEFISKKWILKILKCSSQAWSCTTQDREPSRSISPINKKHLGQPSAIQKMTSNSHFHMCVFVCVCVNAFLITCLNATLLRQQRNFKDWHEFLATRMVTDKFLSYIRDKQQTLNDPNPMLEHC